MRNGFRWFLIILDENRRLLRAASRFSPSYWERIHSPSWFALKNAVLRAQGGRCYDCGTAALLELHHLRYDHLWHERFERDVIALCKPCHRAADRQRRQK